MSFLKGYQTTPSFQSFHSEGRAERIDEDEIEKRMKKEAPKVAKYLQLNELVFTSYKSKIFTKEMMNPVNQLLDWNPELYTVWNYKRDLMVNLGMITHESITDELNFVLLKLKQHPKSYWIWNHRIWCLTQDPNPNWKMELGLIHKFFEADSRNFHAWQYRRVIIKMMNGDDWTEWKFTKGMINKDISNYSAWHNRSSLIMKLFVSIPDGIKDEEDPYLKLFLTNDKLGFVRLEWELVKTAIYTDAEDSSVWFYIKWLLDDYFLAGLQIRDVSPLLMKIYEEVEELNQLELDDNEVENKWCVNTKLHILDRLTKFDCPLEIGESRDDLNGKLRELDPMRKNRYI